MKLTKINTAVLIFTVFCIVGCSILVLHNSDSNVINATNADTKLDSIKVGHDLSKDKRKIDTNNN